MCSVRRKWHFIAQVGLKDGATAQVVSFENYRGLTLKCGAG